MRARAAGKDVTVGVIGGSISWGMGAIDGPGWVPRFGTWLAEVFPAGNVRLVNGAFPAVSAASGQRPAMAVAASESPRRGAGTCTLTCAVMRWPRVRRGLDEGQNGGAVRGPLHRGGKALLHCMPGSQGKGGGIVATS